MDPYRTLGVPRGCTREEVKAAFRARVPLAHPDRGGDELTFIDLRRAYERILADLDRRRRPRPDVNRAAPTPGHDGTFVPGDPPGDHDLVLHEESSREQNTPTTPDPVAAKEAYIDSLHRVSARASRRRPGKLRKLVRILGMIFLLYFLLFVPITGLLYLTVVVLDLEKDARLSGWRPESLEGFFLAAAQVASFVPACWLVWKYDSN